MRRGYYSDFNLSWNKILNSMNQNKRDDIIFVGVSSENQMFRFTCMPYSIVVVPCPYLKTL